MLHEIKYNAMNMLLLSTGFCLINCKLHHILQPQLLDVTYHPHRL
jgi:hypothetical protein